MNNIDFLSKHFFHGFYNCTFVMPFQAFPSSLGPNKDECENERYCMMNMRIELKLSSNCAKSERSGRLTKHQSLRCYFKHINLH